MKNSDISTEIPLLAISAIFSQFGDHPTFHSKPKTKQAKPEWVAQHLIDRAASKRKAKKVKRRVAK